MRGRVTFEVAGQKHALQFTTNRLCQLEEDAGESVMAVCAKMEKPEEIRFTDLRLIFRAGLDGDHTLQAAGDILDQIGVARGLQLASQAMMAAFDVAGAKAAGNSGKPKTGAA